MAEKIPFWPLNCLTRGFSRLKGQINGLPCDSACFKQLDSFPFDFI